MKRAEKISDAIGQIDERFLVEADSWQQNLKRRRKRDILMRATALAVCICLVAGGLFLGSAVMNGKGSFTGMNGNTDDLLGCSADHAYSEMEQKEQLAEDSMYSPEEQIVIFESSIEEQTVYIPLHERSENREQLIKVLSNFNTEMLRDTNFPEGKRDNQIYSPAATYAALGSLTKAGDGLTKLQTVLRLGGISSLNIMGLVSELNRQYNGEYKDWSKMTFANSIWYPDIYSLMALRQIQMMGDYGVNFYPGELDSKQTRKELQSVLEESTGWTFSDATCRDLLGDGSDMIYVSAVNYEGKWSGSSLSDTIDGVFYGENGERECTYIELIMDVTIFTGSNFKAICGQISNENLWLVLPEDGVAVDELLSKGKQTGQDLAEIILNPGEWKLQEDKQVRLSIPMFEAGAVLDMEPILERMNYLYLFDSQWTDYSPLVGETGIGLSKMSQIAYVNLDEQGCNVDSENSKSNYRSDLSDVEESIVFERPFFFAISSTNYLPLVSGIVYNPKQVEN